MPNLAHADPQPHLAHTTAAVLAKLAQARSHLYAAEDLAHALPSHAHVSIECLRQIVESQMEVLQGTLAGMESEEAP